MARCVLALGILVASTAAMAHPPRFHKRLSLVIRPDGATLLVLLDVPAGEKAKSLRAAADKNADGRLDADERVALKAALVRLALARVEVRVGARQIAISPQDTKLDVGPSTRVDEESLSAAVLASLALPAGEFSLVDEAPDGHPVPVDVSFEPAARPPLVERVTRTRPLRIPRPR